MQVEPLGSLHTLENAVLRGPQTTTFADALSSAADSLARSLERADALAAGVAMGKADIAEAAIARAKADVMLEVAAIAASRVSGAITTLLQTQV